MRAWLDRLVPVGTRSLLFGAHQVAIHPWFVAAAWWRVYGFGPVAERTGLVVRLRDPRLWVAFVVHDLGYWGLPNMDGPEGETHPEWGARVMGRLFGEAWHDFTLLHSRFYSRRLERPFSALCVADKLASALEPWWFYIARVRLSGEVREYMKGQTGRTPGDGLGYREWNRAVCAYLRAWVEEHSDLRPDTWTHTHAFTAEDRERSGLPAAERPA